MKNFVWLAAAVLTLAACDTSVNGTLKVDKAFQVQNKNGDTITLAAGSYSSALKMKNAHTLDVNFKMANQNQTVRINLPKGTSLPTDGNGQFYIKGDDVDMGFDTKGTLATTVVNGQQQQGFTTCYMPAPPQQCFPLPNGGVSCTPVMPAQGIMTVIYHLQTTTMKASAEFTSVVNGGHLASFSGTDTSTAEIYDYQGLCHY